MNLHGNIYMVLSLAEINTFGYSFGVEIFYFGDSQMFSTYCKMENYSYRSCGKEILIKCRNLSRFFVIITKSVFIIYFYLLWSSVCSSLILFVWLCALRSDRKEIFQQSYSKFFRNVHLNFKIGAISSFGSFEFPW